MTPNDATAAPDPAYGWAGGWWLGARRLNSPHFGPRPPLATIDLVVVHSISLPPGVYGGPEVEQLFTGQLDWDAHPFFQSIRGLQVSAHFFIRRDGTVLQFVDADARAWHAGASHWHGRDNRNDDSIGVELEGLEGERFEAPQYSALARLCEALLSRYPIAHLAGHEHIAPGRKQDPGPGFDWRQLQRALGWAYTCFPEVVARHWGTEEAPRLAHFATPPD